VSLRRPFLLALFVPALAIALGLGACGGSSGSGPTGPTTLSTPTPPVTAPITGAYDLVIVPAAACRFPAGPFTARVQAQQTTSGSRSELRATLPGGSPYLSLEMLLPVAGSVEGSISTQAPVPFGGAFEAYLRNVGTGTVALASGGRGEVVDGTMTGDVQVFQSGADLGTCTSSDHRWSLRAR
jgi:hypothetical protein